MALDIIWLYRKDLQKPGKFVRVKNRSLGGREYSADTSDLGKLRYWELAETADNVNPNKKTSGFWRITQKGREFAEGAIVVPSHVRVYRDEVLDFNPGMTTLSGALGRPFSYVELMNPHDDEWNLWDD